MAFCKCLRQQPVVLEGGFSKPARAVHVEDYSRKAFTRPTDQEDVVAATQPVAGRRHGRPSAAGARLWAALTVAVLSRTTPVLSRTAVFARGAALLARGPGLLPRRTPLLPRRQPGVPGGAAECLQFLQRAAPRRRQWRRWWWCRVSLPIWTVRRLFGAASAVPEPLTGHHL